MEELQLIADLCKKYNVICISDEVYEWLVYGGEQHLRIGMFIFCLSIFRNHWPMTLITLFVTAI